MSDVLDVLTQIDWANWLLGAAPSSTPTPSTPAPAPGSNEQSIFVDVIVPVITAIGGAIIALLGEALIRGRAERESGDRLLGAVVRELEQMRDVSGERAAAKGQILLVAALQTVAWGAFSSSRHIDRLGQAELESLVDAYNAAEDANHQSTLVPALMQISALSSKEDVIRQYRSEALRLSSEPYVAVSDAASRALQRLDEKVGRPVRRGTNWKAGRHVLATRRRTGGLRLIVEQLSKLRRMRRYGLSS